MPQPNAAGRKVKIEELGDALGVLVKRVHPMLVREVRDEIGREAFLEVVQRSPVGGLGLSVPSGKPRRDPHPGRYRAGHVASAGSPEPIDLPFLPSYPTPGEEAFDAGVAGSSEAESVFVSNATQGKPSGKTGQRYAYGKWALEDGRRQYSRVSTRVTLWIGSEWAPDGVYGPTVVAVKARRATIKRRALRKVKAKI